MDPTKLEETLKQLDAKGASKDEIQQVYDAFKAGGGGGGAPAPEKPGFFHSMVQDVARPFLRSAISPGSIMAPMGTGGKEVDFGYFGKVKPQGYQMYDETLPTSEKLKRAALDTAGNSAEAGSYFMAPLKMGNGFWATIKEVAPLAATFGAGKGMEKAGEGGGAIDATLTAAGNTVGAAAGYGLLKGGANIFANWGARALQTEAVQAAGSWMKDFAEKTFAALPEAFQGTKQSLTDFTNATTRRTVVALRSEFDKNYNTAKDAVVDGIMPEVNHPDLTFAKYQRSLSETLGNKFRESNALYDSVKADTTSVEDFRVASDALKKAKVPTLSDKPSAAEFAAYQASGKAASPAFQQFSQTMSQAIDQSLTMKQIMGLWNDSMRFISAANPEERAAIRDFASGLYADARHTLEKKNPELLDQWDGAYQAWKKAVDVYESGPLNSLKSVGDVDTFVDTMIAKPLTRQEQEVFVQSLGDNKPAVQDMFINSILRKAKQLKPNDGAKLLDNFLENYDTALLDPHQAKMLDDVSSFMKGNFDEFVLGMRNAQGLTDAAAGDLLKGQTQQDLLKVVNDGRLDQISQRFLKMADSPELEKTLEAFTPEEKNMVGLSIAKGLFDEKLPVAALNANGTYKIAPEFAHTLIDIGTKIQENKALGKILSTEQLSALKSAVSFAEKTEDLSEVPAAGYHRIMNGLVSMFYFARGWVPGGARNAIEAAAASGEKTLLYYKAVQDLLDQGIIKGNKMTTAGDLMKLLLPSAGQTTVEAVTNQ